MANLTEDEKQELFDALRGIQDQQHKTNQALFGDESIGLTGVIKDINMLKRWRNDVALKTSYIAGAVAAVISGATFFLKLLFVWFTKKD